ncbi:MAG: Outer membrane protein transport protein (OMPP1/FadL/TodX) [Chlorobi bacterium OLB5]|nr:MAG: Outer membrane protein transport protein (OMPP1/FadL/TodX) [Chlorobi bacterium OLB5]
MKLYHKIKIAAKSALIFTLLFGSINFAGDRSKYGTSAAPELLIPVGSRGTSLSGSMISSISGVDAMYWNPAGLSLMNNKTEVLASHMKYIADININYVAGAVDMGSIGVIGASLKSLSFGDELVTTLESPMGTGETWSPTYLTTSLSYARKMSDKILFGATVKVIYEQILTVSSTGFAVDFGLQYIAGKSGLKFGVALKNFGPSMTFDGSGLDQYYEPYGTPSGSTPEPRRVTLNDFSLPTTLELGISYDVPVGKKNNVQLSTTFQNNNFSSDEYRVGLEYNYNNYVFLRGAYAFTPDYKAEDGLTKKDQNLFGPSFGIGLAYPFGNVRLGLDYSYRMTERFQPNQWFSFTMGF